MFLYGLLFLLQACISFYTMLKIESFYKESGDLHECCEKLFRNWLNTSHGPTPKTYQTLLKYIKKIDDLTAASEEIEKKLIKGKDK